MFVSNISKNFTNNMYNENTKIRNASLRLKIAKKTKGKMWKILARVSDFDVPEDYINVTKISGNEKIGFVHIVSYSFFVSFLAVVENMCCL